MFCVQAEDGRRDLIVTGVQTCALPISPGRDRVPVFTLKHGLEGVVVPSKLYGILAAGKPVLGLAPEWSDVDYIVKEAGWDRESGRGGKREGLRGARSS